MCSGSNHIRSIAMYLGVIGIRIYWDTAVRDLSEDEARKVKSKAYIKLITVKDITHFYVSTDEAVSLKR
jgi:hypothetical protein